MTTADEIARMLFKAMEKSSDYSYDFIAEHGLPEAGGGDWEFDGMDLRYLPGDHDENKSQFSMTFTNYTTVSVTVEVLGDLRP